MIIEVKDNGGLDPMLSVEVVTLVGTGKLKVEKIEC